MKIRKKTSVIWKISRQEMQALLDSSNTMVQILKWLGFNAYTGNHRTLNKRILEENFSLDKFKENHVKYMSEKGLRPEIPITTMMIENSHFSRKTLRTKILKESTIEYKCQKCGNDGMWNGEKITLQLEHINGINNDHRIENLLFLCPNCHSQTKTYGGRNASMKKRVSFCSCGKQKNKQSKMCNECYDKFKLSNTKLPYLEREDLIKMIQEMPMVKIAKFLGISDNGVRKYAKRMDIDYKSLSKYSHQ
jgi:5-methylcytosine-specific restriction endonuclease McrA